MNLLLEKKLQEIDYIGSALSLMYWDSSTEMPSKGATKRGDLLAHFANEYKTKITSPELIALIDELALQDDLSDTEKAIIRTIKKKYDFLNCLPEDFYIPFKKDIALAESLWEEAREKNDVTIFLPSLKKIIDGNKLIATYVDYTTNPYDVFLDEYERGLSTELLDPLFEKLKKECIAIIKNIQNIQQTTSIKHEDIIPKGNYPKEQQKIMSLELMDIIKFSMDAGNLNESTHPVTNSITNDDVRLTVNYNENDFADVYLAALHEGGHGLYEQNIDPLLYGTTLCSGTAMSIHESCSRMYENELGRSKAFLSYYYPRLQELFPQLKDISLEEMYKGLNHCTPSFIRIHADEVTYNLHIIIRYEMEKLMLNEDIPVEELPKIWNQKYKDYLGIDVPSDLLGILQDIHWSNSLIGYFPSYTLGSIYASQLFDVFKKEHLTWEKDISSGNIAPLTEWMKKNIYQYGSIYTPSELIQKITGEEINVDHYINYLKDKYYNVYGL